MTQRSLEHIAEPKHQTCRLTVVFKASADMNRGTCTRLGPIAGTALGVVLMPQHLGMSFWRSLSTITSMEQFNRSDFIGMNPSGAARLVATQVNFSPEFMASTSTLAAKGAAGRAD